VHSSKLVAGISLCASCVLAGCAGQPFAPSPVETASLAERVVTESRDGLTISAAVLGPDEVRASLGVDLYAQGIQPVWLRAENGGDQAARVALWSIDDQYFTPFEIAWLNRKAFRKRDREALDRWLYAHRLPRRIPAGEARAGLVYTHRTAGTKGFNVDVYREDRSESFTFFVPMPGFVADYMRVDFSSLYTEDEIRSVGLDELEPALEALDCCSVDQSGREAGEPFNVVLIGTGAAVRRALLRSGWEETETDSREGAPARADRYRGRGPDGTFYKSRPDGSERRELRLWLAPLRVDDGFVWLGQAAYDITGATGRRAAVDRRMDPDVDDARNFVVQDFWYGQSLARMGFAGGAGPVSIDAPKRTLAGSEYFTDGLRAVLFVSERPVAMDETAFLHWTEPEVQ
jgi:LssY C-terminus